MKIKEKEIPNLLAIPKESIIEYENELMDPLFGRVYIHYLSYLPKIVMRNVEYIKWKDVANYLSIYPANEYYKNLTSIIKKNIKNGKEVLWKYNTSYKNFLEMLKNNEEFAIFNKYKKFVDGNILFFQEFMEYLLGPNFKNNDIEKYKQECIMTAFAYILSENWMEFQKKLNEFFIM
ncbi:MAG: hypothetical protein QXD48_03455 [Candidatus Aenigmatarchaeota archaeon]